MLMVDNMKNCFLIVNYNDFKTTKHLVDNIKSFEIIDCILIVDNNSKEEEKKQLLELASKNIEIIYNDENRGYSEGINVGAKRLIEKYKKCNIIVSNSDVVIVSEEDLKVLIKELNMENVGLVGPQILELGHINRGMKCVSPLLDLFKDMPIIKNFMSDRKYYYDDRHYESDVSEVDVISSCFFLIDSETLQKINFMDNQVFLYYEDYILCKKVRNLHLSIKIVNSVRIKHLYSATVDKIIKNYDKFKLFKESQLYYHLTYNNASSFALFILKISIKIGYLLRR